MSFLDDLWKQNEAKLKQTAVNELSNIGTTLITNQLNSLFKTGNTNPSVVATTPQVVQVQSDNTQYLYWAAGGVVVLLAVFLIVRR